MSKLAIPISSDSRTLYIRVPKNAGDDSSAVELIIQKELPKDMYLKIEIISKPCSEIPVNSDCDGNDCNGCHVHYCPVYQGYAELHKLEN